MLSSQSISRGKHKSPIHIISQLIARNCRHPTLVIGSQGSPELAANYTHSRSEGESLYLKVLHDRLKTVRATRILTLKFETGHMS
jgi:hypothetical protein